MFDYWSGVGVAFLLWVLHSIRLILVLNSQLSRNLKKVGKRISYSSQRVVDLENEHQSFGTKLGKFLIVIFVGLPFVLTSWLYVIYLIGVIVWIQYVNLTAPQSVKEFRWKMKHMDVPFDMIVREEHKMLGKDPSTFEAYKQEVLDHLKQLRSDPLAELQDHPDLA